MVGQELTGHGSCHGAFMLANPLIQGLLHGVRHADHHSGQAGATLFLGLFGLSGLLVRGGGHVITLLLVVSLAGASAHQHH